MSDTNQDRLDTVMDHDSIHSLMVSLQSCCSSVSWKLDNLDTKTSCVQDLDMELKRLEALRSYGILDTDRQEAYERLTTLAARMFKVPICLVCLVDLGRQWFASNRGLGDVRETPRKVAFCAHAILSELDLFIVPDASIDSRFKGNPLVTGDPKIRFYAGSPLISPEGFKIGTFCIIDVKPRPNGLSFDEKQNLREMAAMAMDQIVINKKAREKSDKNRARMIACTAHDLITPLTCIQLNMELLNEDKDLMNGMKKEQREILSNTQECVDIMSNICQDSIKVFREEKSQALTDLKHHKKGAVVISKVLDSLRHVMTTYPKKVPLTMHTDDDVPPVIMSEVLTIFRSSLNLLTNACKVTEHGSIDFHLYMDESKEGSDRPDFLVFECVDTGIGVPIKHYSSLFCSDGGERRNKEAEPGTLGLGLESVSKLVSELNGEYGHRPRSLSHDCGIQQGTSEDVTGSIFWFSVPVVLPENDEVMSETPSFNMGEVKDVVCAVESKDSKHSSNADNSTVSPNPGDASGNLPDAAQSKHRLATTSNATTGMKRKSNCITRMDSDVVLEEICGLMRIPQRSDTGPIQNIHDRSKRMRCALVIDDSKTIRKVFDRALTNFGFEVKHAENGLKGLEEMKTTVFDVVLCDFLMPIMDGLDCVQQYRTWESDHRKWFKQYIIGISAHADGDDAGRGIKVGMDQFIPKPLPLKVLKELVSSEKLQSVSKTLDQLSVGDGEAVPYCLFVNENSGTTDFGSATSSISDESSNHKMTCLIVEDSASIGKVMVRCVERRGWQTCVAKDGEEGLRLLKTRNWDVVFMDDQLPLLSGSACVMKFRKWEAENRVARQKDLYMVSANCHPNISTIVPPGFDGALGKPFKATELFKLLESSETKVPTLL